MVRTVIFLSGAHWQKYGFSCKTPLLVDDIHVLEKIIMSSTNIGECNQNINPNQWAPYIMDGLWPPYIGYLIPSNVLEKIIIHPWGESSSQPTSRRTADSCVGTSNLEQQVVFPKPMSFFLELGIFIYFPSPRKESDLPAGFPEVHIGMIQCLVDSEGHEP